jgi:hypothetical protein
MPADHDPADFDARIEALTHALEASSDAHARTAARELVSLVLQFHAVGLRRLLDILAGAPISARQRAGSDPVIAAMLALHELQPPEASAETDSEGVIAKGSLLHIRRGADAPPTTAIAFHHERAPHCDMCGAEVDEAHHHYVDVVSRELSCSCRACWLLSGSQARRESLRAVPDRYITGAFRLSDAQWDALQLPVATAFFMFNSAVGRTIAFYPSPAGATESALSLTAWHAVEQSNPWVRTAAPDVEAILVRKNPREGERYDAFVVPIDACYDLVGRIRMHWTGFDGGDAVRREIERFFDGMAVRSGRLADSVGGSS